MSVKKLKDLLLRKYSITETVGIILILVAIGFVIDVTRGQFNFFLTLFFLVLVAVGIKQLKDKNTALGFILLVIGAGGLIFSFISSTSFILVISVILIYHGSQLFMSTGHKSQVTLKTKDSEFVNETVIETSPYFKNKLFGQYRDVDKEYPLEDIDIQVGFGDIAIDITDNIIPVGETVILIRGFVGSVYLNIPSDVGVCVQMSLLAGRTKLFNESKSAINSTKKYQSANYKNELRKIKIVTSLVIGDMEVMRS